MPDKLLDYLLGALELDEHQQIEERLRSDPQCRKVLEALKRGVAPLAADGGHHEPPEGLAQRTCEMIAARSRRWAAAEPAPPVSAWQMRDFLIAASIVLVASVLVFPALERSRQQGRQFGCLAHLNLLGVAMGSYSDHFNRMLPYVAPQGRLSHAGTYAVRLYQGGYITDASYFRCPAVSHNSPLEIPTVVQLVAAAEGSAQLGVWTNTMGGDYGYVLGYVDDRGQYHGTRNRSRSQFPILSDCPPTGLHAGQLVNSPNHGGSGMNFLFEDGRAKWLDLRVFAGNDDHFFRNRKGQVAAGIGPDDAVVVPSPVSPGRF